MPAVFPTLVPVPGAPFTFTDAAFPGVHIIYGMNQSASGTIGGDPIAARAEFLSRLANTVQSFDFEGVATGNLAAPFACVFTGSAVPITATINNLGTRADILVVAAAPGSGRFNTTPGGSKYLAVASGLAGGGNQRWSVTPNVPVAAFGFYCTDIGDFSANSLIDYVRPGGAVVETMLPVPANSASGNLAFFGVIDVTGGTFANFIFNSTYEGFFGQIDFFGFDDFIVADAGQVIGLPPPAPAVVQNVKATLPLTYVVPVQVDVDGTKGLNDASLLAPWRIDLSGIKGL